VKWVAGRRVRGLRENGMDELTRWGKKSEKTIEVRAMGNE
jgi:hypothetical protein